MAGSQGPPPFGEAVCLHSAGRLGQARGTWGQHRVSWSPGQHSWHTHVAAVFLKVEQHQLVPSAAEKEQGSRFLGLGKQFGRSTERPWGSPQVTQARECPASARSPWWSEKPRSPAVPSIARRTFQSVVTGLAFLPLTVQHPRGKGRSLQALEGGWGCGSVHLRKASENWWDQD